MYSESLILLATFDYDDPLYFNILSEIKHPWDGTFPKSNVFLVSPKAAARNVHFTILHFKKISVIIRNNLQSLSIIQIQVRKNILRSCLTVDI